MLSIPVPALGTSLGLCCSHRKHGRPRGVVAFPWEIIRRQRQYSDLAWCGAVFGQFWLVDGGEPPCEDVSIFHALMF